MEQYVGILDLMMIRLPLPPCCSSFCNALVIGSLNFLSLSLLDRLVSRCFRWSFREGPTMTLNCTRAFSPLSNTSSSTWTRAAFSTGISLGSSGTAFSGAPWTKSNSLKPSFDTKVYGCLVSLRPSAKVIRRGSNGRFSGAHSHCNLCFTEPWTNLQGIPPLE